MRFRRSARGVPAVQPYLATDLLRHNLPGILCRPHQVTPQAKGGSERKWIKKP